VVEAAYYATLASAYQKDDFSLVYPIARGTAPAFLTVWAVLFLNERPTTAGVLGLALIIMGLVINGSSKWLSVRKMGAGSFAGLATAGAVAVIISIYSVIDGAAVKFVNAIPYTVIIFFLTAVFITPVIWRKHGWRGIRMEGARRGWLAAGTGILSLLAYMLVLVVYSIAPVSYAGAIREVSIVLGALAGWLWLKEQFGAVRVVGAVLIFLGIILIAVMG
jgi:drug/metabolite transporter (DMT)-like permease